MKLRQILILAAISVSGLAKEPTALISPEIPTTLEKTAIEQPTNVSVMSDAAATTIEQPTNMAVALEAQPDAAAKTIEQPTNIAVAATVANVTGLTPRQEKLAQRVEKKVEVLPIPGLFKVDESTGLRSQSLIATQEELNRMCAQLKKILSEAQTLCADINAPRQLIEAINNIAANIMHIEAMPPAQGLSFLHAAMSYLTDCVKITTAYHLATKGVTTKGLNILARKINRANAFFATLQYGEEYYGQQYLQFSANPAATLENFKGFCSAVIAVCTSADNSEPLAHILKGVQAQAPIKDTDFLIRLIENTASGLSMLGLDSMHTTFELRKYNLAVVAGVMADFIKTFNTTDGTVSYDENGAKIFENLKTQHAEELAKKAAAAQANQDAPAPEASTASTSTATEPVVETGTTPDQAAA